MWIARGLLATVVVALALAFVPGTSSAANTYTATANAWLVGVDFTVEPSIAFDQLVDAGASVAQAQIDSLGVTRAFASTPYPSNTIVLLPGLLAGISNGKTSVLIPDYPLIAASNETTAADHRQLATVSLDAFSNVGDSRGTVTDGATRAVSRTTANGTNVVAHAETSISSLQLTSVLSLDGVHTIADAVQDAGGKVTVTSSFDVAAFTISGQRIAVNLKQLKLLRKSVPLNIDLSPVLAPALTALAKQGTTVEFVPAVATADGITSAGLRITSLFDVPPQIASGLKQARAGVTVGLASASVSNRAVSGLDPSLVDDTDSSTQLPAFDDVIPSFDTPTALPDNLGAPPVLRPLPATTTHPLSVSDSLAGFYAVLVFAAAIGVGLVSLIRYLGVRSP